MVKADTPTALAVLTALRLYRVSMCQERERYQSERIKHGDDRDAVGLFLVAAVNTAQQQIEAIDRLCASVTKPAYSEAVVNACREWAETYLLTIK